MCDDAAGCDREPVVFVDVAFPADAEHDASIAADEHASEAVVSAGLDVEARPHPIPVQRLGFCVRHGAELNLDGAFTDARAVRGMRAKGRFPARHALADGWSWTAVSE